MEITKEQLTTFLQAVKTTYGHDFSGYQKSTIGRRIQLHAIYAKSADFESYQKLVLADKAVFEGMFKYFSINVTEFFRGPTEVLFLKQKVLPYLSSYAHIKIWEAGCSSAMTTYSLAILLDEMGLLHKTQIYATDFNNSVLSKAKQGAYELKHLALAKKNYHLSGGEKDFEEYIIQEGNGFQMKEYLKEKILFFNHNLALDTSMNEFQLIICKNVLIYFDDKLKADVVRLFDESLCVNGFLAIGKNEYLHSKTIKNFKEYEDNKRVFQKCR